MRALVVGHGRMGRFHAHALRDLGYTVETVDPHAPADHRTLPELHTYDVAAIATPVDHLAQYGIECAAAGLRTLIEKPFASTLHAAEGLAYTLDSLDVCVGFIERFNPQVKTLEQKLHTIGQPQYASFTRWNTRPSPDLLTDLRIHDVDLANHLGLSCPIHYDTRADAPIRRRYITVAGANGQATADLMDHTVSPLHALWHAYLSGLPVPGPADAVQAHRALRHREQIAA